MDISVEIEELKKILEPDHRRKGASIEMDLPIFEIDREGNFTSVPTIMEEITGFSREELYLLSLQNVVFVEDRPQVLSSIGQINKGARMVISEIDIFSEKTGSYTVELIMLPMVKDEEVVGAWGAIKDIEGRKDIEERLEATREVQESSRQFLQDFVSLTAREIKQPLTTILLTLEMLESGFFGEVNTDQKDKMDQLIQLIDRLKSILNEALLTSRNLGEEIKLERRIISMKKVVSDVLKEKETELSTRGIQVITSFPDDKVDIPADRKAIVQVLTTLLDNSISLSPKGGHLMIEMETKGPMLQFSISDSGEGIPEEDVGSIFDKLHLDDSKESGYFKEGLNLYMAKKIIETHEGRIWCESFQGLGSSFLFTLPLRKEDSDGR